MFNFISRFIALMLALLLVIINFISGIPKLISKPGRSEPETETTLTVPSTTLPYTTEPFSTTEPSSLPTTTVKETTTQFHTAPHIKTTAEKGTLIRAVNPDGMTMFGGKGIDVFTGAQGNYDGFYACGVTTSSDGDMVGNTGTSNSANGAFIAKFNLNLQKQWNYILCAKGGCVQIRDVAILSDGNIVAAGYSDAPDYVSDNAYKGTFEAFIIKLSPNGELIWKKSFGGSGSDKFNCICASGTGFAIGGSSSSHDGDFSFLPDYGISSATVMNFDADGNILWSKYLNGKNGASADGISSDKFGNIFITCITRSTDGDFTPFTEMKGHYTDTVVFKYDNSGNQKWGYVISSSGADTFAAVAADDEGGCLVAGYYDEFSSAPPDGTLSELRYHGGIDSCIIRLNSNGTKKWIKSVYGLGDDYIYDIIKTNGGYAVTGKTNSSDGEFNGKNICGVSDGFIDFFTPGGSTVSVYMQGGSREDSADCAVMCGNYNIVALGKSISNDGFFNGYNTHLTDGLIDIIGNAFTGYIANYMINAY